MTRRRARCRYRTDRVEVTWAPRLCTHSGRCFGRLPEVFDPGSRPWVRPEAADPEDVELTVGRCPSGALGFRWLDQEERSGATPERKEDTG